MTVKEIYNKLLKSKRSSDFFGKVETVEELKKIYKSYCKKVHPDIVSNSDKYIAGEAFSILNKLYEAGKSELEKGIFGVVDQVELYKQKKPLFDVTVKGEKYVFYENIFEGEVAYIFKGLVNNDIAYLKLAIDEADNDLIQTEFNILTAVRHQSLPYVEHKITINGCNAIIMREVKGITMDELMEEYPQGVPAEHVCWMIERLLSVTGYLHSNFIVHENIKPENIIINKETHNVSLVGLSFAIQDANKDDAKYQIINDDYTAPEVSKTARVMPKSDIYSIGKIAIKLLGGNVSNNGMPINVDARVRKFFRNMVTDDRSNDAWELWSKLINLRNEVYGTERFKTLK